MYSQAGDAGGPLRRISTDFVQLIVYPEYRPYEVQISRSRDIEVPGEAIYRRISSA